jgi:hypothetical protein
LIAFFEFSFCDFQKVIVFGEFFFLLSQCITVQIQHGRLWTVGGLISPRSVFWGVILENNFGKLLFGNKFRGSFSSFGEQLFGAALDSNFGERLWAATLLSSFGEQLWEAGATLRRSFARQLRTEALKNRNFGEQLWGLALEHNFGGQLSGATLGSTFREPLWRIAWGSRFGEQV